MAMTKAQQRTFIRTLNTLADLADKHNLTLPNGALVDQLLGGIANDLEVEVFPKEHDNGKH